MSFESFLTARLNHRLHQCRVLVVSDPDQRYGQIVRGLADEVTTVLDGGGDLLEAREAALEALAALGEDSTCKRRLVLYVAAERPLEDADVCADPFAPLAVAGAVFPDGAADAYRDICLQYLPERAGRIEELFASTETPSISVINSLRSGAVDSPVLRDLLKAEGPTDMLVKFLSAGEETLKKLKSTTHWVKDLKDLVGRTLGLKMEGPKEHVEALQGHLWRHLLFSEFAADLPGDLPAALASVPRATLAHDPFVRTLCATLRDLGSAQAAYEEAATRVAGELNLESLCADLEDFGELDTFSFEERGFLKRFASQLQAGHFEEARDIVARRQGSFWVERDARRGGEWRLADLAARLLLDLHDLTGELSSKRSLEEWIEFYACTFARVDSLHRAMEQVVAELTSVDPPLTGVLDLAREEHRQACDSLARRVQEEVAKAGWPAQKLARAVDVFDRWVEPAWKAGERVAYFWIDAFRYELALALEPVLAAQHSVKLDVVCGSLPSLTPVGMASLLPGASAALQVTVEGGKPVATMAGKPVEGPKGRLAVLAAHVGTNRTALADLEDVAMGKLPNDLESVEVLAVKTIDIDSLGENNPVYFIGLLPGILRKIQLALNQLAKAGFSRAVLATDHGFGWLQSTSAGNAVGKPPGDWQMTKDRALLGSGSADSHSMALKTSEAGIRTALPHIAVPKGMSTYTAGVTYFHGGLSPQECFLPVLDIKLKPPQQASPTQRIEITLTYRGSNRGTITTLRPVLELGYPASDLFGPASVQLLLQGLDGSGKLVGKAASSAMVDPMTREISLERGKAIKVPLSLDEGFEGALKVIATDPVTGTTYATLKLLTDFHR